MRNQLKYHHLLWIWRRMHWLDKKKFIHGNTPLIILYKNGVAILDLPKNKHYCHTQTLDFMKIPILSTQFKGMIVTRGLKSPPPPLPSTHFWLFFLWSGWEWLRNVKGIVSRDEYICWRFVIINRYCTFCTCAYNFYNFCCLVDKKKIELEVLACSFKITYLFWKSFL
jgi:hypothetical protein